MVGEKIFENRPSPLSLITGSIKQLIYFSVHPILLLFVFVLLLRNFKFPTIIHVQYSTRYTV